MPVTYGDVVMPWRWPYVGYYTVLRIRLFCCDKITNPFIATINV